MNLAEAKSYTQWIALCVLFGLLFSCTVSLTPYGRDDSDPGEWGERSGIAPRTDHKTGCQYLTTSGGGITPRLTADGRHMGCRIHD